MMIKIFAEESLDDYSRSLVRRMKEKVDGEDTNYLLNVNETQYLQYLVNTFSIEPLIVDFDGKFVENKEVNILGSQFPGGGFIHNAEPNKRYPRQAIAYHLPFSGNDLLLNYGPMSLMQQTLSVSVKANSVSFDIINFSDDPKEIKSLADRNIQIIRNLYDSVVKSVQAHNASLSQQAKIMFDARRKILLDRTNLVASLGVPIRKSDDLPQTFAVPTVKKRIIVSKPVASTSPFVPEPSIDQSLYEEILRVIQDAGRNFERLPSVYAGKGEEDLRDHLIFVLEPHFSSISTTGETFNKEGKTDILLRYEKKNVFVGECKFWKGDRVHTKTMDQILSYLTFRDSKVAIIYFVRQNDMSSVLTTIENNTPNHPNFISFKGKVEDTWFSYEFHLPGDAGRNVQLAIMCFHIPT